VIAVRGLISIVPDIILRDSYGDIRGIFQLALGVLAIVVFSGVTKWIDTYVGSDESSIDHVDADP